MELSEVDLKNSIRVNLIDDSILDTEFRILYGDDVNGYKQAKLFRDLVFASIEKSGDGLLNAIVDLRPLKNGKIIPTSEAGKIYSETASHPRINKIAIVGIVYFYKAIAKFILVAAKKGNDIKMVNSKEDALRWIKEESQKH